MKIFPAIDLRGGNVVRLVEGDYNRLTVFDRSPESAARRFFEQGAKYLHVVDLDGAKGEGESNRELIGKLIRATDLFVEVGGGIREEAAVDYYLSKGAGRVILGTAAVTNYPFLEEMIKKYGEKIAVGVDVKDGYAATHGWQETSRMRGVDFCRRLRDSGVKTVIYTDIAKDGKMEGTNLDIYRELREIDGLDIIASGGISTLEEIRQLKDKVCGAILGKALYVGAIRLEEALEAAAE